jgi:flagellar basal body P-ring protein FlgI
MLIHWFNENSVCESIKAIIKIIGQPLEILPMLKELNNANCLKPKNKFYFSAFSQNVMTH